MTIVREVPRGPLEAVESLIGAHPERAGTIFVERQNRVTAQTRRFGWIVHVVDETPRCTVEAVESFIDAYPERARAILTNRPGFDALYAVGVFQIFSVYGKVVSVISVQAIFRPKPHKPFAVLVYAKYGALR